MSTKTYNEIVKQAKTCKKNVSKNAKTGMWSWWAYYFAKALLNPKRDVTVIKIDSIQQDIWHRQDTCPYQSIG